MPRPAKKPTKILRGKPGRGRLHTGLSRVLCLHCHEITTIARGQTRPCTFCGKPLHPLDTSSAKP